MHQANAKRSALLLGQFEFLQTRLEAAERVVKVSGLWDRIKWLVFPLQFLRVVDAVQINLMNQHKAAIEAESRKAKIIH
ncbi:MAG: hypothetical protein AAB927_00225 [Patescibacteria group bacterium]